ncbi:MAG TPA: hypothetical protein VER33_18215 [Polyangiaceae bacterium]|nr:hypothetical protein [Polyangiaceae bacterium]
MSRRALGAATLVASASPALGRIPYGGVLRLAIPWSVTRLDPHALDDPIAALFARACCDCLYELDALGRAFPALAAAWPERSGGSIRVRLRPHLVTAAGRPLLGADVRASLLRSLEKGALLPGDAPRVDAMDPLLLHFAGASPEALTQRLATPLLAIVPRGFSPANPDATGAFSAHLERGLLVLTRNLNAARGPAFLERIEVRTVVDLADALRAFERGSADVGWLGNGLHQPRSDGVAFRGIEYGWVVLRTGQSVRGWGAPGVAQQLLDGIDPRRLQHLGLEGLAIPGAADAGGWRGGPSVLRVADDAPQLVMIARSVAAALERPGHPIGVELIGNAELQQRRTSGDFALMLDFVRSLGPPGPLTQLALLSAQDPELAKKPPRVASFEPRSLARSLSLGVLGQLWAGGAHASAFQGLAGWQLGNVWRTPDDGALR